MKRVARSWQRVESAVSSSLEPSPPTGHYCLVPYSVTNCFIKLKSHNPYCCDDPTPPLSLFNHFPSRHPLRPMCRARERLSTLLTASCLTSLVRPTSPFLITRSSILLDISNHISNAPSKVFHVHAQIDIRVPGVTNRVRANGDTLSLKFHGSKIFASSISYRARKICGYGLLLFLEVERTRILLLLLLLRV